MKKCIAVTRKKYLEAGVENLQRRECGEFPRLM
jgi:hypothetical protein